MRVIAQDGKQLGIMSAKEALQKAYDRNLDLVEVDPRGMPPVCKIMNYGKFKYEESKRHHQARKAQAKVQVKEVKFRPRTDEHDMQFKLNHIRRFLAARHKVKVSIWFRGRERVHLDLGRELLDRVIAHMRDIAIVNDVPRFEGRTLSVVLSPKKVQKPVKAETLQPSQPVVGSQSTPDSMEEARG